MFGSQQSERSRVYKRGVGPKITESCKIFDVDLFSLVDTGSQVSSMSESFFNNYIKPKYGQQLIDSSKYFNIVASNHLLVPIVGYLECDVEIMGVTIPDVGFQIVRDPETPAGRAQKRKRPGILGTNLMVLAIEHLKQLYGEDFLDKIPDDSPIPKSWHNLLSFINEKKDSEDFTSCQMTTSKPKKRQTQSDEDGILGTAKVCFDRRPICIPAGGCKIVQAKTTKIKGHNTEIVEPYKDSNLPSGITVNRTYTDIKNNMITIPLLNTNSYNVWIKQTLTAALVCEGKQENFEYDINLEFVEDNKCHVEIKTIIPEEVFDGMEETCKSEQEEKCAAQGKIV